MRSQQGNVWAVLLAGGDGQRLKSATNAQGVPTPTQYCSLNGGPSPLHLSLRRALAVSSRERIVAVVTEAHRTWWEREFVALPRTNIVVQPCNRGTGLGVLLPLLVIAKSDPEAGVICIPSDHYVEHEEVLAEAMRQVTSAGVLSSDKITMLGMSPNAPDSGFGYLSPAPDSGFGMRPVLKFTEKPNEAMAAELIRAGSLWSSGIFAGRISRLVDLYSRVAPGLTFDLKRILEYWPDAFPYCAKLASLYARHPPLDFARDVLQKHPDRLQFLAVPPCGWSDVGTPERLAKILQALGPVRDDSAASIRSFNLATAFDRAAFGTPCSHGAERTRSADLSHFAQGSFLKFATNSRLPPRDEM
jgi:mannose-1-phosphate guanylyltransferase